MNNAHYFMLRDVNDKLIKKLIETGEPNCDFYNDKRLLETLDSNPYYEYEGVVFPANLKFTGDTIKVYLGDYLGRISNDCTELVRDVVLARDCEYWVALGGGMSANLVKDKIYREFDDYFAILEISH